MFDLCGIERINYPEIWQCVGMIVGVYGIGYLIAAGDSRRHWPIVLVGLLGKILGPIGFVGALWLERLPLAFGATILTNDLLWWIPFILILRDASNAARRCGRSVRLGTSRFVKESRFSAPPTAVFGFHETRDALTQLIPPWEPMRVVESTGSLKVGSRVVLKGQLGPFPVRWVAEHTEYEPPHLFADRQVSGPFAVWYHRHHCLDDGAGGTILRDEIEYTPPLGALGEWLGGWLIRRKLQRMFDYRHEITRQWLETQRVAGTGQPSSTTFAGKLS